VLSRKRPGELAPRTSARCSAASVTPCHRPGGAPLHQYPPGHHRLHWLGKSYLAAGNIEELMKPNNRASV
jgi:hypothetical protein